MIFAYLYIQTFFRYVCNRKNYENIRRMQAAILPTLWLYDFLHQILHFRPKDTEEQADKALHHKTEMYQKSKVFRF